MSPDPAERIRFRNLLTRISGRRTIILSTHILADIEASYTAVVVVRSGKVVFHGTPDSLIDQAKRCVWQLVISPHEYGVIERQFKVIASRSLSSGDLRLRLIAPANPLGRGESTDAGLE